MLVAEKKTELWVTISAVVVGVFLSVLGQIFPETMPEWARVTSLIGGTILTALSALGYTIARTAKKIAEGKAITEIEKAKIENGISEGSPNAISSILGALLSGDVEIEEEEEDSVEVEDLETPDA
jgi:hypothetical protein